MMIGKCIYLKHEYVLCTHSRKLVFIINVLIDFSNNVKQSLFKRDYVHFLITEKSVLL